MALTSENWSGAKRLEAETEEKSDAIQMSMENLSAQQQQQQNRALSNPLILKKILGFLDNPCDLLNCRKVGSDWKSLATEILLQRKCVRISLMYNKKRSAYFKGKKKRGQWVFHKVKKEYFPLQNLLSLIKSAALEKSSSGSGFPCVSFLIFGGDLKAEDISSFFHLYGEQVQKLKLLLDLVYKRIDTGGGRDAFVPCELPEVITVGKILCFQLPNLRELEIRNEDYRKWEAYFVEHFAFHHLFAEFEITCQAEMEPEFQPESNPNPPVLSPGKQEKKERIIISQLPKLEKLRLNIHDYHNFHHVYPETCDSSSPLKSVIQKNMAESKSIEFIQNSNMCNMSCGDCLTALMSSNQIDQLRNLSVSAFGLEIMERMIAEFPSQLLFSSLRIGFGSETKEKLINDESMKKRMIRGLVAFFKIVANNSPEICIDIYSPIGFLSDADFFIPRMENVSKLGLFLPRNEEDWRILNSNPNPLEPGEPAQQLRFEMDEDYTQFFPCGFNLSDSFPNLQTIELSLCRREITADFWGQHCQSLPTVKSFSLECLGPFGAGELLVPGYLKLSEIFPNLTKLKIRELTNFPAIAHCLWKFKELEELDISLDVSPWSPANSKKIETIDSAITGFTMETLKEMRESKEFLEWARVEIDRINEEADGERNSEEKIEKIPLELPEWRGLDKKSLRVNPSICHLPKLKQLTMTFGDCGFGSNKPYFLMSEMSFLLAFGLMPQLEVTISAKAQRVSNRKRIVKQLWGLRPLVKRFYPQADGVENARSPEDIYYYDSDSGSDADSDSDLESGPDSEAQQFSD